MGEATSVAGGSVAGTGRQSYGGHGAAAVWGGTHPLSTYRVTSCTSDARCKLQNPVFALLGFGLTVA